MATFDYTEMEAVAEELIAEFGQVGSLITISEPDEVDGGDGAEASYPATMVTMSYDARYVNGTTIEARDVQIYISAVGLAVEPKVGLIAQAGGARYLIIHVDPNRFDGATAVVFVCQGRTIT